MLLFRRTLPTLLFTLSLSNLISWRQMNTYFFFKIHLAFRYLGCIFNKDCARDWSSKNMVAWWLSMSDNQFWQTQSQKVSVEMMCLSHDINHSVQSDEATFDTGLFDFDVHWWWAHSAIYPFHAKIIRFVVTAETSRKPIKHIIKLRTRKSSKASNVVI